MPNIQDLTTGRIYPLKPGSTFLVGRNRQADIPVRDISCSRMQFRLDIDPNAVCRLQPLSENSPTFCEGIPIYDQILLDQDVEITAGQSKFRFLIADAEQAHSSTSDA